MKPTPPPHLTVRSVSGDPLTLAFKVAFDQRMAELGPDRPLGRLRTSVLPLSPDAAPQLRERLGALGYGDPRLHAVPYVPLEPGGRHLALVACRPETPEEGVFMMRRGRRWAPRPYLRRVLTRLDPEGVHLRVEEPS